MEGHALIESKRAYKGAKLSWHVDVRVIIMCYMCVVTPLGQGPCDMSRAEGGAKKFKSHSNSCNWREMSLLRRDSGKGLSPPWLRELWKEMSNDKSVASGEVIWHDYSSVAAAEMKTGWHHFCPWLAMFMKLSPQNLYHLARQGLVVLYIWFRL